MEFDQSFSGMADWAFPSPTATPTTGSFGSNTIQTPKTATFPSHFQDAFATPQMPAYGTPQQPQYSSSTPMQRPQSSSETLRSNYYAAVQAQGGAQNMNPSTQHAHDMTANGVWDAGMMQLSPQNMMSAQCDPTQMQTPPPTRGTSVKKPQLIQNVAFGTPSTIASRRFMTPQQHVLQSNAPMPQQQTPVQFPMLQISPDMQQFSNMGPMTAPVQSQTNHFWEAQPSPLGQPIMLDDPFGMNAAHQQIPWTPEQPMPQQQAGASVAGFETPAMNSFAIQQPQSRPVSAAPSTRPQAHPRRPSYPQTSASVDPSLLYSSPAQPMLRSTSKTVKPPPTMEQVDSKRRDSAAPAVSSSNSSTNNSRPVHALRRCNTTGTVTRLYSSTSSNASTDSLPPAGGVGQTARSGSPLKRVGKPQLDSIAEAMKPRVQRPSVVLTIDENGRARAVPQNATSTSPTKSVRERYPGLFDSDSSDEESTSSQEPASRHASFSFAKGEERRPKVARLDTPVENLEGLSLPRSSSTASLRVNPSRAAIAAAAQLKRQGSIRKPSTVRSRKPLHKSTSYNSMIDTCPMDFGEQSTHSMASTTSHSPEESQSFNFNPAPTSTTNFDTSSFDWSMYTMDQQQPAYPKQPQYQQPQVQQQHGVRIRCPCGDPNYHGEALVQCKSCTQYQHPSCVSINPAFGTPPSYSCFLCQRPASRAPMRRTTHG